MRVAIIGSRNSQNLTAEDILPHIPGDATELISGGARGVDALAERAAALSGLPITVLRPDYAANGRLAPLVRDGQIVAMADLVLAFWDGRSRGTAYTLNRCVETGTPFRIFRLR